jgi:aspartate carbamoyltransferase catalytic subunit
MMLNEYIRTEDMATTKTVSQQEFLRDAMAKLGMTRDQFADRIGTSRRRLDNWLLPSESKGFRDMDEIAWKFIREILANSKKRA